MHSSLALKSNQTITPNIQRIPSKSREKLVFLGILEKHYPLLPILNLTNVS